MITQISEFSSFIVALGMVGGLALVVGGSVAGFMCYMVKLESGINR